MKQYNYGNVCVTITENMTDLLEEFRKTPDALEPIVKAHALNIESESAANAPVDTGALKNSMLAEGVEKNSWEISDGVEYGVFQELGTSRGVYAKHFLGGACEREADTFFQDCSDMLGEGSM